MAKPRVSLRDIARAVGKTHATVSMALRGKPNISAETAAEIRRVAEEMGYRPDPMLHALAEHRKARAGARYQATIAWINPFPTRQYPPSYHPFQLYKLGAMERARALGYEVEEFHPRVEGIGTARLRQILLARGIQSLIVAPHEEPHADWEFDVRGFSAVALGFTLRSPRLYVVTCSQAQAAALAVRKLRELGHRRIAMILPEDLHERTGHNFLAGFLGEFRPDDLRAGIPWFLYRDDFARSGWWSWFRKLRPDALLLAGHSQVNVLQERGIDIPGRVSVVFLTRPDESETWACIDQRERQIGELAVDTLVSLIHHNVTGESQALQHVLLEARWRDGKSVVPRDPAGK